MTKTAPAMQQHPSCVFIICAYHGGDEDGAIPNGRMALKLRIPQLVGHRRVHRDFYANARSLGYQFSMMADNINSLKLNTEPRIFVDVKYHNDIQKFSSIDPDQIDEVDIQTGLISDEMAKIVESAEDCYLIFSDALGLGCERFQKQIASRTKNPLRIINGRRRNFPLSAKYKRKLLIGRFLAKSRIGEYIAAAALVMVGYALFGWDYIRGHR